MSDSTVSEQTVYDWFDYDTKWKTNPPFLKGSAGTSAMPSIHVTGGEQAPRIQRGFIRRADYSINDEASMSRLYFMYNPETISRDYMNYLDQGALDPFNTVFQSGNLVAPPSMLNFAFELFFDRQEEAMAVNNRGVMVDMDYFDLVVRNVKPSASNNTLPDNGIMMVNPRDITVVFSQEITVQGRPLNASVVFERFTHKMVPTRMRINLQMRVVYFGPMRDVTTFVPETVRALEAVTFLPDPERYNFTYQKLEWRGNNEKAGTNAETDDDGDDDGTSDTTDVDVDADLTNVDVPAGSESSYIKLNMEAMSHGWDRAINQTFSEAFDGHTKTQYGGVSRRMRIWKYVDCSSFVWACYAELKLSESLTWEKWRDKDGHDNPDPTGDIDEQSTWGTANSTADMWTKFANNDNIGRRLWGWPGGQTTGQFDKIMETCTSGDILIRYNRAGYKDNHVAFVWKADTASKRLIIMHAGSESMDVGQTTFNPGSDLSYNYGVRPYPKVG